MLSQKTGLVDQIQLDSTSESEKKMSQSQAMFLCVCFMCSSKGHANGVWLVVFDPYCFVAEKSLPMTQTCTIVNFHNLHSLLDLFGSLVFEQMESSD